MRGAARGADLHPLHVFRLVHRIPVVRQLTPAVVPVSQSLHAEFAELVEDVLANLAVQHAVGVIGVLEHERDVENAEQGDHAAEITRTGHSHIDGTATHTRNSRLESAERTVGKNLDIQRAVGLRLEQFVEALSGDGLGVGTRRLRCETQGFGSCRSDSASNQSGRQQ